MPAPPRRRGFHHTILLSQPDIMNTSNASVVAKIGGVVLWISVPFAAQASLTVENISGTDFIYDSVANITWTRDGGISGQPFTAWQDATDWAASLSFGGMESVRWQLPDQAQFASLFTQLEPLGAPGTPGADHKYGAVVAFGSGANEFAANVAPVYWASTQGVNFNFYYGYAGSDTSTFSPPPYAAWAVALVPEPSLWSLLAVGMAGCLGYRRR